MKYAVRIKLFSRKTWTLSILFSTLLLSHNAFAGSDWEMTSPHVFMNKASSTSKLIALDISQTPIKSPVGPVGKDGKKAFFPIIIYVREPHMPILAERLKNDFGFKNSTQSYAYSNDPKNPIRVGKLTVNLSLPVLSSEASDLIKALDKFESIHTIKAREEDENARDQISESARVQGHLWNNSVGYGPVSDPAVVRNLLLLQGINPDADPNAIMPKAVKNSQIRKLLEKVNLAGVPHEEYLNKYVSNRLPGKARSNSTSSTGSGNGNEEVASSHSNKSE